MGLYIGLKKGATATHSIVKDGEYDMRKSDGDLAVAAKLVKEASAADTKKYYEAKQKKSAE